MLSQCSRLMVGCLMVAVLAAQGDISWSNLKGSGKQSFALTGDGYRHVLTSPAAGVNLGIACGNLQFPCPLGKRQIRFEILFHSYDGAAALTPCVLLSQRGKASWQTHVGKALQVFPGKRREYRLCASDFGPSASEGDFRQFKLVLRSERGTAGVDNDYELSGFEMLDEAGYPDKSWMVAPSLRDLPQASRRRSRPASRAVAPGASERIPEKLVFRRYPHSPGVSSMSGGADGFLARLTNTAKPHNHTVLMADAKGAVAAQKKLVFRYRGDSGNGQAALTVALTVPDGNGGWKDVHSRGLKTTYSEFKTVVLALNNDFGLGDAVWPVQTVKFILNGDGNPLGTTARLQVEKVRFASADEVSGGSAEYVIVHTKPQRPAYDPVSLQPLKVWFEFDNDDCNPHVSSRTSPYSVMDVNPTHGFRTQLLEFTDGLLEEAGDISEADVVVYSRASHGDSEGVLGHVRSGKRLIVYGNPADGALSPLVPLCLRPLRVAGFARRSGLGSADVSHALLKGVTFLPGLDIGRYFRVDMNGGRPLISLADGSVLLAEKGPVLQFACGVGTGLEANGAFYDKFLLRVICLNRPDLWAAVERRGAEVIRRRQEDERRRISWVLAGLGSAQSGTGYSLGMSRDNFGRFGWLIGEGLTYDEIGRDLGCLNGAQAYRFELAGRHVVPLTGWRREAVSRGIVFSGSNSPANPMETWDGLGDVDYSCELALDPAWRGQRICFEVAGGIDDCDVTSFNGVVIGRTDKSTPHYWEAPRRYEIPEHLIKWEGTNRLKVRVTNLFQKARFGSKPMLTVSSPESQVPELRVESISWTGKRYALQIGGKVRRMTFSLLSPFIRYEIPDGEIFMSQENIASRALVPLAHGDRLVDLSASPDFYRRDRDGELRAPWILLCREGMSKPLLLVFTRRVGALHARSRGNLLAGIEIGGGEGGRLGVIYAGWPYGVRRVDVLGMERHQLRQRISRSVVMALNYPVGCEEIFRLDEASGSVEIVNRFRFEHEPDAWGTPVEPYVTLPPMVGLGISLGKLASASDCRDWELPSKYGPIYGRMGSDTLRYRLDFPEKTSLTIPGISVESKLIKPMHDIFTSGVRFSCGGGVPLEAWTPHRPAGNLYLHNIDPFAWNFGLCTFIQGHFQLDSPSRVKNVNRIRRRYVEPLELYQYKFFARHREEPFSGLRYPVVFNSFYPNASNYASGMGSKVIYGDVNEGCTQLTWAGQELADIHGFAGMIRGNWSYYRQVNRHQLYMDDYGFHSGSCREYGVGAWIDMLNGEYAGMIAYARLGELVGDREAYGQGMYRAAKKALPTVLRLSFNDYVNREMEPIKDSESVLVSGFGEHGHMILRFPDGSSQFCSAMDLFDNSQGMSGTLYRLYARYCLPEVRHHLTSRALPALKELLRTGGGNIMAYLQPLALFMGEPDDLEGMAVRIVDKWGKSMGRDWPGAKASYFLGLPLWRIHSAPGFSLLKELKVSEARYHVEEKRLHVVVDAVSGSRLVLDNKLPMKGIRRNGRELEARRVPEGDELPLVAGRNEFVVTY